LELDNPIEIQYVVGNMFRISLKRIRPQALRRRKKAPVFQEKTF
jgi:hypothetical protein